MRHATALILCSAVLAPPAFAQSLPRPDQTLPEARSNPVGAVLPPSPDSGDIIVTAQRRTENIQKVPISVQAITSVQLSNNGIGRIRDLSLVSPQITVADAGGYVIPYIRGVGNLVFGTGTYGSVATYVDDVYVARLTGLQLDLGGVANVQILSGPQGALYGRNATGGAIVITTFTPEPGGKTTASAEAGFGNYSATSFKAAVSGSVGESLAFGISASKDNHDGFVRNLNSSSSGFHTGDLDSQDSYSVAAVVNWQPADRLAVIVRAAQSGLFDRGSTGFTQVGGSIFPGIFPGLSSGQTAVASTVAALTGVPSFGAQAGSLATFSGYGETYDYQRNGYQNGLLTGKHKDGSFQYLNSRRASLHTSYDTGPVVLTSITAGTGEKQHSAADILGVNGANIGFNVPTPNGGTAFVPLIGTIGFSGKYSSGTISQEFRAQSSTSTSFKWTGGAVYFREHGSSNLPVDFFGGSARSADNKFIVNSYAGYAQGTLALLDQLSLTAGGRYTKEKFVLDDRIDPTNPATFPGTVNVGKRRQSSSKFTYLGRLEYQLDQILLYGGISTGFKSGNLNTQNPSAGAASPETIMSYEGGVKTTIAPGFTVNLAGYYYDYKKIQIAVIDQGSGGTFLVNGPGARIYGLDASSRLRISDNVSLSASATLLHTEYLKNAILTAANSPSGIGGVLAIQGNRLAGAPKFAASTGMDVVLPVADDGKVLFSGNLAYNGGYYFDAENRVGTGGTTSKSYVVINLTAGYAFADGRYSVKTYARNAFGEHYYRTGIVAGGTSLAVIAGTPRQYGVTLGLNF